MDITSAECNRALEIIQRITYSKNEALYNENVKLLQDTKLDTAIDYFIENWDCIKEQWVTYCKDQTFNLGETINNRLESTFKYVKSVCSKYSRLMQFFTEFIYVLKTFRSQRNYLYLMALNRKPTTLANVDLSLQQYLSYINTVCIFSYKASVGGKQISSKRCDML